MDLVGRPNALASSRSVGGGRERRSFHPAGAQGVIGGDDRLFEPAGPGEIDDRAGERRYPESVDGGDLIRIQGGAVGLKLGPAVTGTRSRPGHLHDPTGWPQQIQTVQARR